MMPKPIHYIITTVAVLLLTLLGACGDSYEPVALKEVAIKSDPQNALRYPVEITASADCDVTVYYWPAGDRLHARRTRTVATQGAKATVQINFVKPQTDYEFAVDINGALIDRFYKFTTAPLPAGVPRYEITANNPGAPTEGYVMQFQATTPGWVTFCDMDADVVWYEQFDQPIRVAHYDTVHKRMAVLTGFAMGEENAKFYRLCDKIITLDLEGNRQIEWKSGKGSVEYPHHEIRFTPNGDLIMVCNKLKRFDLSSFALGNDAEVWGDGFSIITPDRKITADWNNFDELTPFNSNDIILEKNAVTDFVHANSVNWDSDGNYYMTFNRTSELWKIDAKTGKVLYRVGPNGNVKLDKADFASGLHAAEPLAPNRVLCLDNGESSRVSRALIYEINPQTMTAKATLSVPFPAEYFSQNRSNVQLMANGKMLMFASTLGRVCVFTDLQGKVLKVIKRSGISYRAFYYGTI